MVRMTIASLTLLMLCLVAIPAGTQSPATTKSPSTVVLYNNGPIDGDQDAWTINYGFAVTDSFFVGPVQAYASVAAISFGAWLIPNGCATCSLLGDYVSSVQVQIGTAPFDNSIFDGVVTSWVATNCVANAYGYQLCEETAQFRGPTLTTGATYWVTFQNAVVSNSGVANADPVYWDENSGAGCTSPGCPSLAQENDGVGTIPSESFTILGNYTSTPNPPAGAASGKNPPGRPGPSALSSSSR